jgi:hypothetical protein
VLDHGNDQKSERLHVLRGYKQAWLHLPTRREGGLVKLKENLGGDPRVHLRFEQGYLCTLKLVRGMSEICLSQLPCPHACMETKYNHTPLAVELDHLEIYTLSPRQDLLVGLRNRFASTQ